MKYAMFVWSMLILCTYGIQAMNFQGEKKSSTRRSTAAIENKEQDNNAAVYVDEIKRVSGYRFNHIEQYWAELHNGDRVTAHMDHKAEVVTCKRYVYYKDSIVDLDTSVFQLLKDKAAQY